MINFYTFNDLQKTVEEAFNIDIDPERGDFKVEPKVHRLKTHEIDKVVIINGDIFLKDGDEKYKGFIVKEENYRRAYYDNELGYHSHLPKFHTTECDTLKDMKARGRFDGVYIFANTAIERKEASEGGGMMSDLRVCKNCVNSDEKLTEVIYTKDFVEEHLNSGEDGLGFSNHELPKQYEKDEWGYINGWDDISLRYRAKKNFTCEKCGIDLSNNKYYLEVHHSNANKTDNKESNLQCLCTDCHANVDQFHRENFYQKPINKEKLRDFRRLFKNN